MQTGGDSTVKCKCSISDLCSTNKRAKQALKAQGCGLGHKK